MIEGIDYCFIFPEKEKDQAYIKILSGDYTGTVYKYGKVSFKEKDDVGHLQFNYTVLESPVMKPKKLNKDQAFKNFAGNFLVEFMSANIDEEIIDETGNNDYQESNLQ
jgi:hypothetical protein